MIIAGGEALIDLVPDHADGYRPLPGGSPANTAVGIGRLGTQTALPARPAPDRLGGLLRAHLETSNVDLGLASHASTRIASSPSTPTSVPP
ncbi:hypothetical protein LZG04_30135 [Saccharothrix sp. S26]|uniref:hypothetical protein n=1 Tax=Saccharothrix sp. S26 TaxID=2907215 RepID=UPI001F3637D3|nr:hypothetical protein [Saccharothrix sp. S26]MCE6999031.1 hypothetical protein [Saccharothrix sp. S26]